MPSVEDLRPKEFKIELKGVTLTCKPMRLSHALVVAKVADVLQNPAESTKQTIQSAEKDMDEIIAELIPELSGVELDMMDTIELITKLTDNSQPSDNQFLEKAGVKVGDPKVTAKTEQTG